MNMSNQNLFIVCGPPRSGLQLIECCLQVLGFAKDTPTYPLNTALINSLLIQDLGLTQYSVGPLPKDWKSGSGAQKAKERIDMLLKEISSSKQTHILSDFQLCRTLPLWQERLQKTDLTPNYVIMLRHPWEVALSLQANQGLDLTQAHILWLAHTRAALRQLSSQLTASATSSPNNNYQITDNYLITFDQLLADPVSTLGSIFLPHAPQLSSQHVYSLLDLVQPGKKHFHASMFPESDMFRAFDAIYQQLRSGQYDNLLSRDRASYQPEEMILSKSCSIKPHSGTSDMQTHSQDLIDTLLQALGSLEKNADQGKTAHFTPSSQEDSRLMQVEVIFPSSQEGGTVSKTSQVVHGQWQKVSMQVPSPELLQDGQIAVKPQYGPGVVMLSSLWLIDEAGDNCVYQIRPEKDLDHISLQGEVIRLPDAENMTLLATGRDFELLCSFTEQLADSPLRLELWIKCTPYLDILHEKSFFSFLALDQAAESRKQEQEQLMHQGLRLPEDSEDLADYFLSNEQKLSTKEKFYICLTLARHHWQQKNNLRSLHFGAKAREAAGDDPFFLVQLARAHTEMNQMDCALEAYGISLFKKAFLNQNLGDALVVRYKQALAKSAEHSEHGHKVLMDYIRKNMEYIRSQAEHKLTLVEIGSTREDVPGQGSTRKLAEFCQTHGLHFITVDMDPENTRQAEQDLAGINPEFQAVTQRGEDFLTHYPGPLDFVFLDAYDFDHGKHSEERQSRYEKYLGERISDKACHQMHLECAEQVVKKLSTFGAVCFDDTWYENGAWQAKGTLGVPYLLKKNFCISMTGNKAALLMPDISSIPEELINTLTINLEYDRQKEIDALILLIDSAVTGRVCVTKYLHGLYLIKRFLGGDCKVYVETGTLFGGSLALAMQDETPCRFIGIDLFYGYYGKEKDPKTKMAVNIETAKKNVDKLNVHNHPYTLIAGSSYADETVEKFKKLGLSIDLLFIDGDHSYQGVTQDYAAYKSFVNPGGFIVFDNYGEPNVWEEVKKAVDEIDFKADSFEPIGQYGFSYVVRKK